MKSSDVRQNFISFFESKGHTFVPGSPVGSDHDPTLLFTNAGMNQFKDVFLGSGSRPYTRAANSQICIRVSGKHNDLEDVGKDHTHQTSFEMLGNWSFGDYYKKEAIKWAWELLTETFKIPKHKLFVTVFEDDAEAEALWISETDILPSRIVKCNAKDNFWEMGETGPCGPCSEIHADLWADQVPDGKIKKADTDLTQADLSSERFIELWNLVFIQFNREKNGGLSPLPATHVDTGAGLERLTAFLQGTPSNYETDLFKPIINKIEALSGVPYQFGIEGMPHRVLADHVRTLTFSIADNIQPGNEGRGYVLRRLLRRALRYAQKLNINEPILVHLVDTVVDIMGGHFTQLAAQKAFIKTVIQAEEESFLKTLSSGILLFNDLVSTLSQSRRTEISGEDAFKLYDTFGFPIDLTAILAEEKGLTVDMAGFAKALDAQKKRSRASTKAKQDALLAQSEQVLDFSALKDLPLHLSDYTDGIARGGEARVVTDPEDKLKMAQHHTATHILHEALRQVLGPHVAQKGSWVNSDRLRFDFSHFQALSESELEQVSALANQKIKEAIPVQIHHKTLAEAKALGAMALFGEKYDVNDVRMVQIDSYSIELCGGTHVQNTDQIEAIRILSETAVSAGVRRLEALAGKAAIEAYEYQQKLKIAEDIFLKKTQLARLDHPSSMAGMSMEALLEKTVEELKVTKTRLIESVKEAEKKAKQAQEKAASESGAGLEHKIEALNSKGVFALIEWVEGLDLRQLLQLSDQLMGQKDSLVIVLASEVAGNGGIIVKVSAAAEKAGLNAKTILDPILNEADGKGGGNASKAQAGGCDPERLKAVLAKKSFLK